MKTDQKKPIGRPRFSIRGWLFAVLPSLPSILYPPSSAFVLPPTLLASLCLAPGAPGDTASSPPEGNGVAVGEISEVSIHAGRSFWTSQKTNLTLVRSNDQFVGSGYRVSETAVSNLLAAMRQPPRAEIDPNNLGLTAAWLGTNRDRLLTAFGGEKKDAVFPLASPRQRTWLTNALLDLNLLGEVVRSSVNMWSSDDFPEMKIGFSRGDPEVARVQSWALYTFMVPWSVVWGTNQAISYNADISRAVAALLPAGFPNRERIQGDLFSIIQDRLSGFTGLPRVQQQIKQMVLEETLGAETDHFLREFEMTRHRMQGGSYRCFPDTWWAVLHRTNWPARLVMPVRARVERGVVPLLPRLLDTADARVRPILQSPWLMGLIQGPGRTTIEVAPEGSMTDDSDLRGDMAKVWLGEFCDQIWPSVQQELIFTLHEETGRKTRTSEWSILPDGRLLLVRFAGNGVLGWTPEELGFRGSDEKLAGMDYNAIEVFITREGQIEKVVPQAGG